MDFKDLKENLDIWEKNLVKRGVDVDLKKVVGDYDKYLKLLGEVEGLRTKRKEVASKKDIEGGKAVKQELDGKEKKLAELKSELDKIAFSIPNTLMDDVPDGGEENNEPIGNPVGEPTKIVNPKDHIELGTSLNILDIERGVKTSGSRFYFLKNEAVELEFAIIRWVFDLLKKDGRELLATPMMVNERVMNAGGYLGKNAKEVYRIANLPTMVDNHHQCSCKAWTTVHSEDDYIIRNHHGVVSLNVICGKCGKEFGTGIISNSLYLIGTSEQSMLGYHMDEMIDVPKRYAAFSTCFRREAGSHGKDVKGIIRVHQFDKVEMFSFVKPEDADAEHEKIIEMQEKILQGLEISYQKVLLAAGDTSICSAKTIDLEAWLPSQNRYREISSASNCTNWQSRRANIRYEKGEYLYTLNGTAVSMARLLVLLLENHQQKDGSIKIPKVLHPYLSFKEIK